MIQSHNQTKIVKQSKSSCVTSNTFPQFNICYIKVSNAFVLFQYLQKVDHAALSTGSNSDTRGDLLSEIRQGVELRPATDRGQRDSQTKSAGTDALADALRRALAERGRVLRSSDEEDSDSTDNGEWDD